MDALTYQQALIHLKSCTRDGTAPGPDGMIRTFKILQNYTAAEIAKTMQHLQTPFPEDYQAFLIHLGSAELYFHPGRRTGIKFLGLHELERYNRAIFAGNPEQFPHLMVAAVLSHVGSFAVFDFRRPLHPFNVFSTESQVENWQTESTGWCDFQSWMTRLVASHGGELYTQDL
ncbi:SMI1/KNR4 family protein [Deinococcus roseus]|uniref:Knr4/Smi1-like domain-containing protein n=1 Tax=Deinococcus roseus TaxID=392414 RepID=A0ABQ2D0J1_9DEIO|nr:SMI1/KNR4 family protein [Deinococcus roseus]GGJ39347.1 hypothetical protein GCM10008938_26770 [Deinococcus roseus]